MKLSKIGRRITKAFNAFGEASMWVGYIAITFFILLVFADVTGRYLLKIPLIGSYELIQLSMITLRGLSVVYGTIKRRHVAVDVFLTKFSKRIQRFMLRIFAVLSLATWAILDFYFLHHTLQSLDIG